MHPTGSATVYTGVSPHGQGHDTGFAQIAADRLGADPANVDVLHGDTDQGRIGLGHVQVAVDLGRRRGGGRAAIKMQEKAKRICAALLEASPDDIELA